MPGIGFDVRASHLCIGDLDALGIALLIQLATHGRAGFGRRGGDQVYHRGGADELEEALYQHRKSLFGALSVAFFDTTSLYFEGSGGATLGHSKDFRPQLPQVGQCQAWRRSPWDGKGRSSQRLSRPGEALADFAVMEVGHGGDADCIGRFC